MDVCCLNRPFDDQTQERIRIESEAILTILNRCLSSWILVGSEVIDYEISKIPDEERRRKVEILSSIAKEKILVDEKIVSKAKELQKLGFRPIDSLHIACAEISAEIMLTTDDELVKKAKNYKSILNIRVDNPVNWLIEVLKDEDH